MREVSASCSAPRPLWKQPVSSAKRAPKPSGMTGSTPKTRTRIGNETGSVQKTSNGEVQAAKNLDLPIHMIHGAPNLTSSQNLPLSKPKKITTPHPRLPRAKATGRVQTQRLVRLGCWQIHGMGRLSRPSTLVVRCCILIARLTSTLSLVPVALVFLHPPPLPKRLVPTVIERTS